MTNGVEVALQLWQSVNYSSTRRPRFTCTDRGLTLLASTTVEKRMELVGRAKSPKQHHWMVDRALLTHSKGFCIQLGVSDCPLSD